MIRFTLLLPVLFLLQGCFGLTPNVQQKYQVFKRENTYIIYALEAEHLHDYVTAASLFVKTYKKSQNITYLYRSFTDLLKARTFDRLLVSTKKQLLKYPQNDIIKRFKILSLIGLNELKSAKKEALSLVEKTRNENDYLLVSDIYVRQKRYNTALSYLESAYAVNHSAKLLDRISTILFVNLQKPKDAIAYLETYVHINGCVSHICERLAGFYSNENNINGMLWTYSRMYDTAPTKALAKQIIKIYQYKQNYPKLMLFLQRCGCNNELLLKLYVDVGMYNKASVVAKKLYHKTYNPTYLAQSAMYEYEYLQGNIMKDKLKILVKELKKVISIDPKPLYLNYLGYLMIKYNLHVKEGILYVKRALKAEPDSAYYLDSLAFGYYKLHNCTKAYRLIKRVIDDIGLKNKEIREHYEMINSCHKGVR